MYFGRKEDLVNYKLIVLAKLQITANYESSQLMMRNSILTS